MKKQKIKVINTTSAPQAIGPYSQAIVYKNFIFCSGQIGINPKTNQLAEGLENQTKQILTNLKNVLEASQSSLNNVLKTTIFLTNINHFPIVNKIYEDFFGDHKPARSTVAVTNLPKQALIEIEAIAFID
ncbi:MAG: RidA family protein [Candidatus Microgenomates bacterium]